MEDGQDRLNAKTIRLLHGLDQRPRILSAFDGIVQQSPRHSSPSVYDTEDNDEIIGRYVPINHDVGRNESHAHAGGAWRGASRSRDMFPGADTAHRNPGHSVSRRWRRLSR